MNGRKYNMRNEGYSGYANELPVINDRNRELQYRHENEIERQNHDFELGSVLYGCSIEGGHFNQSLLKGQHINTLQTPNPLPLQMHNGSFQNYPIVARRQQTMFGIEGLNDLSFQEDPEVICGLRHQGQDRCQGHDIYQGQDRHQDQDRLNRDFEVIRGLRLQGQDRCQGQARYQGQERHHGQDSLNRDYGVIRGLRLQGHDRLSRRILDVSRRILDDGMPKMKRKLEGVLKCLESFPVVEVCGAPLLGKSTIVRQAISTVKERHSLIPSAKDIAVFHIPCKGLRSLQQVYDEISRALEIGIRLNAYNAVVDILKHIQRMDARYDNLVYFVFYGCENLCHTNMKCEFVDFLCQLSRGHSVRTVFTTYKPFPVTPGIGIGKYEIAMMDNTDIRNFLQFYLGRGDKDIEGYVLLFIRLNLCFPLAVRHIIHTYGLGNPTSRPDPRVLQRQIMQDGFHILQNMLCHRVTEVEFWVGSDVNDCHWLVNLCQSLDAFISKDLFNKITQSSEDARQYIGVLCRLCALSYVPGLPNLRAHPMMTLYFMQQRSMAKGVWYDHSCSRVVKFFCEVLTTTEMMTQKAGYKSAILRCLLPEWPNLKNTIQMAIFCTGNAYRDFLKVATTACDLLIKWFPLQSIEFLQSLYEHASLQGTTREMAIVKGLLGLAIFAGKANSNEESGQLLRSSVNVLSRERSFYTAQIFLNYGKLLAFTNDYKQALYYYERGSLMVNQGFGQETEEHFLVTDEQVEDLKMRFDINMANPLIFTGENKRAEENLESCLQHLEHTGLKDHAELSNLWNLRGLAKERGGKNMIEAMECYGMSLKERLVLEDYNPKDIVVSYNNLAMPMARQGFEDKAIRLLEQALVIRRRVGWNNYYTALTLHHLSEIHMKIHDLPKAFDEAMQAEQMLKEIFKKHNHRLNMRMHFAHLRWAMDQDVELMRSTGSQDLDWELVRVISLSETAEKYLRSVFELAEESKDSMSDHAHHHVFSSLEHLILFDWYNRDKVQEHVKKIKKILETYRWVVGELKKTREDIKPVLKRHLVFYDDLVGAMERGNYSDEFETFLSKVATNCGSCKMAKDYFNQHKWKQKSLLSTPKVYEINQAYNSCVSIDITDPNPGGVCVLTGPNIIDTNIAISDVSNDDNNDNNDNGDDDNDGREKKQKDTSDSWNPSPLPTSGSLNTSLNDGRKEKGIAEILDSHVDEMCNQVSRNKQHSKLSKQNISSLHANDNSNSSNDKHEENNDNDKDVKEKQEEQTASSSRDSTPIYYPPSLDASDEKVEGKGITELVDSQVTELCNQLSRNKQHFNLSKEKDSNLRQRDESVNNNSNDINRSNRDDHSKDIQEEKTNLSLWNPSPLSCLPSSDAPNGKIEEQGITELLDSHIIKICDQLSLNRPRSNFSQEQVAGLRAHDNTDSTCDNTDEENNLLSMWNPSLLFCPPSPETPCAKIEEKGITELLDSHTIRICDQLSRNRPSTNIFKDHIIRDQDRSSISYNNSNDNNSNDNNNNDNNSNVNYRDHNEQLQEDMTSMSPSTIPLSLSSDNECLFSKARGQGIGELFGHFEVGCRVSSNIHSANMSRVQVLLDNNSSYSNHDNDICGENEYSGVDQSNQEDEMASLRTSSLPTSLPSENRALDETGMTEFLDSDVIGACNQLSRNKPGSNISKDQMLQDKIIRSQTEYDVNRNYNESKETCYDKPMSDMTNCNTGSFHVNDLDNPSSSRGNISISMFKESWDSNTGIADDFSYHIPESIVNNEPARNGDAIPEEQ